jgi:hypothetical protein
VKRIATGILLCLLAQPAAAQEIGPLTAEAAVSLIGFYNDPATTRVQRETRVAAGTSIDGNVASIGGPLVVAGVVRGHVVVMNGDLRLIPGARIEGTVRVAGGRIEGPTNGIAGGYTIYHEPVRFRREGDRLVAMAPDPAPGARAGWRTWFGRTDILARIDGSYNRVEGLPVTVGPRVQLGHSNPTVAVARVIYRTRNGLRFHARELGHDVSVEQFLGGHRGIALGAAIHRVIDPIEGAGLSDTENSLATFVLHHDYRDHYQRQCWRGYVRFLGTTHPYEVRVQYLDERHRSINAGTPWSLLRNDDPWRAQPRVASGNLQALQATFTWDGRNDATDPSAGWLVQAHIEQGLDGTLAYVDGRPADSDFTAASVDARRYLRVGPRSRLAVGVRAAGSVDAGPLPPQRQHVLGGEGNLPGYPRFTFDCGARTAGPDEDGFFRDYGCDRVVLLQAEYRYALLADPGLARRLGLDFDLFADPELVLFTDAGRAWIEARALQGRVDTGPRTLRWDVGMGLRTGPLGLYLAVPIGDGASGVNFFVRLGPRL